MSHAVGTREGIDSYHRLMQVQSYDGDLARDLPNVVDEIARRVGIEKRSFSRSGDDEPLLTTNPDSVQYWAGQAAEDYSRYFDAYVSISRNLEYTGNFRVFAVRCMTVAYRMLVLQPYPDPEDNETIVQSWLGILSAP